MLISRLLITARPKYIALLAAALVLLVASSASAFVISRASSRVVQPQPPPGSCHVRGQYPFNMPDLHCTPGALNPAVTQATIRTTICRAGYTSRIRPSTSVTGPEKLASIRAYGFHQGPSGYEYDHLISLELGGAANDARNLWPENGGSPNLKDKVENYLLARVCAGRMSLARAQRIVALDWVAYYNQTVKPKPQPPQQQPPQQQPPQQQPPQQQPVTHPPGATGQCADGTYTYATHHQGACSHHGGVVQWFN